MCSSPNSPLFQCCLLFSVMPPEIVGEKMEPERFYDSVNVLLSLQVRINFHKLCIFMYKCLENLEDCLFHNVHINKLYCMT
jgi:hypothetical protein